MNRRRNQSGYFTHESQDYNRPMRSRAEGIYGQDEEFGHDGTYSRSNNPNRDLSYPYLDNNNSGDRRHHHEDRDNGYYGGSQARWPESRESFNNDYNTRDLRDFREYAGSYGGDDRTRFGHHDGSNNDDHWRQGSRSHSGSGRNELSQLNGLHRGKGPKGYQKSDERIREDIHDWLSYDSFVDATDIEVIVTNGDVTLSGTVEDRHTRRRAEDIIENLTGIRNIENRIKVVQHNAQQRENATKSNDISSRSRRQDKFPVTSIESN